MIGNDIVDLELARIQSNWRRKGFLDKVFTLPEQRLITSSAKPDQLVWRLWSMKESAYKAWSRMKNTMKLNPASFECKLLDDTRGMVFYGQEIYHTVSEINDDFIHTQAIMGNFDSDLFSKVTDLIPNPSQSESLCEQVVDALELKMGWTGHEINIVKNKLAIPEFYCEGEKLPQLCSMSHHGRFGSYLISHG